MTYNNTSITERNLFRKLFESNNIRISNAPEQSIILEKLLNICKPHILEEFPDRLDLNRYGATEEKPSIYGNNYIIARLYRCARTDNLKDKTSYFESFHITILAIIDNIPVQTTFYIIWKNIAYSLAATDNIMELLDISPRHRNNTIFKYPSV